MKKFIVTILILCVGFGGGFYLYTYNPTVNHFISTKVGPAVVNGWSWFVDLFKKAELPQEPNVPEIPTEPDQPIEPEIPIEENKYYGVETSKIYDLRTNTTFDINNNYDDYVVCLVETNKMTDQLDYCNFISSTKPSLKNYKTYKYEFFDFSGQKNIGPQEFYSLAYSLFYINNEFRNYDYILFAIKFFKGYEVDLYPIFFIDSKNAYFEPFKMIINCNVQYVTLTENLLSQAYLVNNLG